MKIAYTLFILLMILVALPLVACVSAFVFIFTGSPVLFVQLRSGKNGKPFKMYKFRTMRVGAENLQRRYASLNISDGPVFKIPHDPRFTSFGKFLSHTGLDELPQLWNVLWGEMALMGPRPLPIEEANKLKSWMRKRQAILPGIISPAILSGKYHEDFDAWMRSDVDYVAHKSTRKDMMLACRSVYFLLSLLRAEISRARST